MKHTIFLLVFISSLSFLYCNNNSSSIETSTIRRVICDSASYSSSLNKFRKEFNPMTIRLVESISIELNNFLTNSDTVCLKNNSEFELFVVTILAKLYEYHLKCCNQGYDLLIMKKGVAQLIIAEFEKFSGYDKQQLEMLNSGTVVYYIEKHHNVKNDTIISKIATQISIESNRINSRVN